jgi:peptidoglycan hydrolase-like protein with peptidoglycan-binding domain
MEATQMRVPTKSKQIIRYTLGLAAAAIAVATLAASVSFGDATTPTTSTTSSTSTTSTTSTTTTTIDPAQAQRDSEAEALEELLMVIQAPYTWGEKSDSVKNLQMALHVTVDGVYGPKTRAAHINALTFFKLPTTNVPAQPIIPNTYTNGCSEFETLALNVGWPAEQIDRLSFVMFRESHCHPTSWNRADPGTGSRGLTQINSFWCTPNQYNPTGFLQARGVLATCDDLFNPEISLRASLVIWQRSGWSPWGM